MDNYAQRPTANLKSPADKTNTAQGLLQCRGAQTIFGRTLLPWGEAAGGQRDHSVQTLTSC